MRLIPLTKGLFAKIDDSDFDLVSNLKWCAHSEGYACRLDSNGMVLMHRFLMEAKKGVDIDHLNGEKLDNRRENLRIASRSQNMANLKKKSGYKGITKVSLRVNSKNRWLAQITKDYKNIYLGYYPTAKDAAVAYNKKAKELFGEFACLNPI